MFCSSIRILFNKVRLLKYAVLSENRNIYGHPIKHQPVLFKGSGSIQFVGIVNLGWSHSPFFYSGYSYIESRSPDTKIIINDGTFINNNVTVISEGEGKSMEKMCLLDLIVKF